MSDFKEKFFEHLEDEEGRVKHAYQDHLGYWTIGIGRLIDRRKGGGLTDEEIDYLASNDVDRVEAEVSRALPWYKNLDDARKAVLLSMAFQMGTNGLLGFKNTLESVRKGDYELAARQMLQSRWATQTPARAGRMSEQMRTGQWIKKK